MRALVLNGGVPVVPGDYFVDHAETGERLARATVTVHRGDRLGVAMRHVRDGVLHTTPTYLVPPERIAEAWDATHAGFFRDGAPPVRLTRVPARADARITLASGQRFHGLAPDPATVRDEDLATGLGNECRWASQMATFYAVAQHSTLVGVEAERRMRETYGSDDRMCAAVGLQGHLHDAAEGLGFRDLPTPYKRWFLDYMAAEAACLTAVYRRYFGDLYGSFLGEAGVVWLTPDEAEAREGRETQLHPLVWQADRRVLNTEKRDLKPEQSWDELDPSDVLPFVIAPLDPAAARAQWLDRLHGLLLRLHA